MRSKEVAQLAGVSVRTLRHYHQVGVLPEPARAGNGYRSYELSHVARLLRIRTLAELGIPLEQMPGLLDAPRTGADDDPLGELADQLGQRIARLQEQLRRVTELRSTRARPDLTPALSRFVEVVYGVDGLDLPGIDEDASIVVARLFETAGAPEELRDLAAVLHGFQHHERYAAYVADFESLPGDASDDDVAELAARFVSTFGSALSEVLDTAVGGRLRRLRAEDVPAIDVDPRLNPAQAAVLRRIGEAL